MTEVLLQRIEEVPVEGKPLGRHIEHDPRSRAFAWERQAGPILKTVHHRRYGTPFDQGDLGSCTGNASAGAINTVPIHQVGKHLLTETDAVSIYERATVIDGFPGQYPPDDTGSSGLAVAKVLLERGLISSYRHAFSTTDAIDALQLGPLIIGINWYEGFDNPDHNGLVQIAGEIRGGHEIEVKGFTLRPGAGESLLLCENSWGIGWGLRGEFHFTVNTFDSLLADQGDATVLVR